MSFSSLSASHPPRLPPQKKPNPTWLWPARWSCPRETVGPPCHFSPTASCCRPPAPSPPATRKKVLQAVGNGSCLPLASCFPCNLIGRQAHQNKDGLAAQAGTSLRRILRQERRSEWRWGWRGVGKGREAEWLEGAEERGGGLGGRQCEWPPGWMDGLTDGQTELNGSDCVQQLQD